MDKVQHFEIIAEDIERASKFYKDVFGWDINKAGEMPYWMIHTVATDDQQMPKESGAINGGMYQAGEEGFKKGPVIVVTVKNTEEYVKKIEAAGGKTITGPTQVGDMGIYAQFRDPEGNAMGIWQPLKWDPETGK